jgi:uncharacterized DUF497 family protein
VEFEWDGDKADSNETKHGVAFVEAKSVFSNPLAVIFDDEEPLSGINVYCKG